MEKVLIKIAKKMKKDPSLQVYRDLYDFCREVMILSKLFQYTKTKFIVHSRQLQNYTIYQKR